MKPIILLVLISARLLTAQAVATLTGTVSDAITRQPIAGAVVSVDKGDSCITARDGSFTAHHLPPGDVTFRVASDGYRRIEETIKITPGAVQRRDWELKPMARLTVRVADADSEAPLRLAVFLRPRTLFATPGAVRPAATPGQTSFVNLEPGDYIIEVGSPDGAPAFLKPNQKWTSHGMAYGTVWYPGVPELSMAEPIHIEDAEQRSLDLRIHARETFHAQGEIEIPRAREGQPVAIRIANVRTGAVIVDGARPRSTFEIDKLLAGSYTVDAFIGTPSDWEFGRTEFEITDRHIEGLKLSFRPMANLFGTVRMAEDDVPLPPNPEAFVMANDFGSTTISPFESTRPAIPVEGGAFHVKRLLPADYGAILKNLPPGYAVADTLYGNASLGDATFHLEGTGQLNFVVTSRAGAISGKIEETDEKPLPRRALILVPNSFTTRSSLLRIIESESDANGAFAFRNLAPGKYRLMILKDQRLNVSWIASQMSEGQTVEVEPSGTTLVTVQPN